MSDIFTVTDDDDPSGVPTTREASLRPRARRRRGRRSKPVVALIASASVLVGVLVVVGVAGGLYAVRLASTFSANATTIDQAFPADASRPAPAADGAMNVLLLGSDSRADATTVDDASASDQRTDSMMLVHVDADRENVYVMSIMRDLFVPIPGHGSGRVNAAFAHGGSPLTVQTVEQLLGVRIDHVAIIDFEGFKGMTTALGGVDVFSPQAFTTKTGFSYMAGLNKLEGNAALAFVRERYAFDDADFTRVENQQAFVRGPVGTVLSRSTLTDPGKISAFVTATSPYLAVDEGFDVATIASLGFSLRSVDASKIHFFTLPTAGTVSIDGQSVVEVDPAGLEAVKAGLADDSLNHLPEIR